MNQKKTLALIGLVAVIATAATFLFAADTKDKTDGKFHLVYVVTVPNLDKKAWIDQVKKESYGPVTSSSLAVGAEIDIEPGFLSDGTRIVFAFDYCRRHYPAINRDVRRQHEERVVMAQVTPEDRADLAHYCQLKGFTLKGEQFTVMDNSGVRLALSEATFKPGTTPEFQGAGPYGGLTSPERFTAKITRIDGTPTEKLPAAQQAQQPYVFLMSRDRSLLEHVVPVTRPTKEETKTLLARLERYMEKRKAEDPKGEREMCRLYIHSGQTGKSYDPKDISWWRALPDASPPIAEVLYVDLDNDGRVDMLVNLLELPSHGHTMARIYIGKGGERCVLREDDNNQRPLFRPITLIKPGNCVYAYANRYELANNSRHRIAPIQGLADRCRHHDVWRWYERH